MKKYAIALCGKYFERMSAVFGQVLTSALMLAQVLPARILSFRVFRPHIGDGVAGQTHSPTGPNQPQICLQTGCILVEVSS
jgi:hypothetical protein